MKKNNLTIAIYGIADTERLPYPVITHDHNLSVFKNGKLLHYLQLERLTRRKYDNRLDKLLYDLLKSKGLITSSIPTLVFVDNVTGRSFYSFKGDIRFEAPLSPLIMENVEEGNLRWLGMEGKGYVISHELAHIYSCVPFYGNFRENSLLIHFDAGASKSNFSVWKYKDNQIHLLDHHWKLKWITSFFNANPLSFALTGGNIKNQNGVPGKIMGLAAYGKYKVDIEAWLKENNYLNEFWGRKKAILDKVKSDWNLDLKEINPRISFFQDVTATMHRIFLRESMEEIVTWKNKTNTDFLYFTGGSALNICLNKELTDSVYFEEVFIPPCTNDSGLSLGAGAFIEMMKLNKMEKVPPYCQAWNIEDYQTAVGDTQIEQVAALISAGSVVAICNGYAETGPRALGNRSIVARPDSRELALQISMKMKKREWYRPVAPVMKAKNATYFTGLENLPEISKYMLTELVVLPSRKHEIAGAVHVDQTARIQVLFEESNNPFLWNLLNVLEQKYGIRALLNTSFNQSGEPLVHTKEDAFVSARKMGIQNLVVNGELHHL